MMYALGAASIVVGVIWFVLAILADLNNPAPGNGADFNPWYGAALVVIGVIVLAGTFIARHWS